MTIGIKFDHDKPDYSLVPFEALDEVVKVLTYGAKKYDRHNWQFVEDARYQGACMRHFSSYMQEEHYDPESNLHHLAHMACSVLFLLQKAINNEKENEKTIYKQQDLLYNINITMNSQDQY